MQGKVKAVACAIGVLAVFLAGYEAASVRFERDIATERQAFAEKAQVLEANYRDKERKTAQSLVDAWAARDEALRIARDERTASARLHVELTEAERRLSEAARNSRNPDTERLAQCVRFVRRGAELSLRGAEVARNIAIDKDAIVEIVQ